MKRYFLLFAVLAALFATSAFGDVRGGGDLVVFEKSARAPYAGFLFSHTPEIQRVDMIPEQPLAGQSVKVGVRVVRNLMKASMPVAKVELFYSTGLDEWENTVMIQSDGDPEYYFAYITPQAAGTEVKYYIRAEDTVGSVTSETPGDGSMIEVRDDDDDDETVLPDIDILSLAAGFDEKYMYVRLTTDAVPGKGDPSKNGMNLYFMPIIDVAAGKGAEDLFTTPVLAYAPVLSSYLGVAPAGLYRISEILKTKKTIEGSEVKFKKKGHSLMFRVNRSSLSESPGGAIGIVALTTAAKTTESMLPWEASPYLTLIPENHSYTVKSEPEEVTFMAGAALRDITPPVGTPLAGYGAREGKPSTGVHDPLMVEALVLEAGDKKIAMIAADFFYLRRNLYNDLSIALEEKLGITRGNIFLSASHSHSSSGGMFPELSILGGAVQPGLYDDILAKFTAAVVEADSRLVPVKIGTATVEADGLNTNRREKGGPVDEALSVMKIDDMKGNTIAIYYNYGAHPTVLGGSNMEFSAEYPGAVRRELADDYPGAVILFANGALGNMGPGCPGDCGGGFDKIAKMGELFAGYIKEAAAKMEMKKKAPFTMVSKEILMYPKYNMWSNMSAMRIGNAAFVSNPGEAYVELGFPVRDRARAAGYDSLFLLGITNDGIGYIIPEEWYHKHIYEATFALYGPNEGEFIRDQMLNLLGEISAGR